MNIRQELFNLIIQISNYEIMNIDLESPSFSLDELDFDSLRILELVVMIEDHFNIMIDDEDLIIEKLNNIELLEKIVVKQMK